MAPDMSKTAGPSRARNASGSTNPRKTVVIVQECVPHYRHAFFDQLNTELRRANVTLVVVTSDPGAQSFAQNRPGWVEIVPLRRIRICGTTLNWQSAQRITNSADLVVVEQASRQLLNYYLVARRAVTLSRFAFWGHGANLADQKPSALGEWLKRRVSVRSDWWFAYTGISARIVRGLGYDASRITVVNNAVDTSETRHLLAHLTHHERDDIRGQLGISGKHVGVYSGRLYAQKKLQYLLESCEEIRRRVSDFEMIIIGDGPDAHLIKDAAQRHAWIHYVGERYGREKAKCFAVADAMLMPGAVGLAVLDAFAASLPLFTTDDALHGPEIDYVETDRNGLIVGRRPSAAAYGQAVARALSNPQVLREMRRAAHQSGLRYSLDGMVKAFAEGIVQVLGGAPAGSASRGACAQTAAV
jgi:glycosyltransferase involved in cell wall biosynthesis